MSIVLSALIVTRNPKRAFVFLEPCIQPFIGFVNFATGYVITELAKPRKSAGKEEEKEREKEVTGVGMEGGNWRS